VPPIPIRSQPGVQRDTTTFNTMAHHDALWCRFVNGLPRKMGGYRMLTDQIDGVPTGCNSFSRDGVTYLHVGHSEGVQQVTFDATTGVLQGVVDRTPTVALTTPNSNFYWQFTILYDPITNNDAILVAWPGVNLLQIDTDDEMPAFYGRLIAETPLVPMSLPIFRDSHTVATITGTISNGSAVVTAVSSTADLRFGQTVIGTGIPDDTYILSVDSGTQFTMSAEATASTVGLSITSKVGGVCGGVVALRPYLQFLGSSGRIIHSTAADPNDFWTDPGSNEAFVTAQKIIRGIPTRGGSGNNPSALLWSLDSLLRQTYVGGAAIFNFDTVSEGISVLSPQAIVEYDGVYFWAGVDRFYMYAGQVRELPNPFNSDYFFEGLNRTYQNKTFAFRNPRYGEIWWCYPRGTATNCSHAIVYNVRENVWYDTALPNDGRCCAENPVPFSYPILAGHEATDVGRYRLWQHEYGVNEVENSSSRAIRSYYETGVLSALVGQQPANKSLSITLIEPDFIQAEDMTVTVTGARNARAEDIEEEAVTFSDDPDQRGQVVRVKATRRQMRLRFESNVVDGDYRAGQIIAHVEANDEPAA
jgi:hypothetical protein